MHSEQLLRHVLSLPDPWRIVRVEVSDEDRLVEVHVEHGGLGGLCPKCGKTSPGYDSVKRRWRHLDLCDYQTWLVGEIPRVQCAEHGAVQVATPWADARSKFTAPFECVVIDWLKEASVSAVARMFGLGWKQAYNIQRRAVERGLARRGPVAPTRIGVDETSFKKRHEYVTIVTDLDTSTVIHVADDRKQVSFESFLKELPQEQLAAIEVVAMDMHRPYITAAAWHIPDLESKIAFDRFHVAKLFGDAVDKVRRQENRELVAAGDDRLKGTKYHWLKAPRSLARSVKAQLNALRKGTLRVARAWAVKELASKLWHYQSRTWATKAWTRLCDWASRTRIEPIVRVSRTIRYHMIGVVNAIIHRVSNASSESTNSRVQDLKRRANGYRNRERFRAAILFHLGGLDLYPRPASTHTNG